MHERSLVRALLRQVQRLAEEHAAARVLTIRVWIGEFSGVEAELLANAYEELVRETRLGDAALEIERTKLQAVCEECGCEFRVERFDFRCAECGGEKLALSGGEEMVLKSVVMQEDVP